ncbi:MAG TPA: HAD domain-containing protein [Polyangia bacterium]|jgi:hypothetical protein|nr:HAD domain-containing protein [Polyangia bacterium]
MRIIFLDLDGVLVTARLLRRITAERESLADALDSRAVALLNDLVARADARIVISSSWRELFNLDELTQLLGSAGLQGPILDVTPIGLPAAGAKTAVRGHEIQQWLDQHPNVSAFVILDDAADLAHLEPWLIRTDIEEGLQPHHVERALALLCGTRLAE